MNPEIWAHRGASHEAPENTLAAFERAIELGADGVEFDVQRTADGVLVVTHDETTDRLTGLPGSINELSWAELSQRNFAYAWPDWVDGPGLSGCRLPSLSEVLALLAPTRLMINIELKNSQLPYPGMEQEVLAIVQHYNLEERVIYSSFSPMSVMRLARLAPASRRGYLYSPVRRMPIWLARLTRATALHPSAQNLSRPEIFTRAHKHRLPIHVWTVDEPKQWQLCADLSVAAIITNEPARALAYFKRSKS